MFFEVKPTKGKKWNKGMMRVGFATSDASFNIGSDAVSYGFGSSAKKSHASNYDDYGKTWGLGDVLGVGIQCKDGAVFANIEYFINGEALGEAFQLTAEMSGIVLFPALSGKSGVQAETNFGEDPAKPFEFPIEGFEPRRVSGHVETASSEAPSTSTVSDTLDSRGSTAPEPEPFPFLSTKTRSGTAEEQYDLLINSVSPLCSPVAHGRSESARQLIPTDDADARRLSGRRNASERTLQRGSLSQDDKRVSSSSVDSANPRTSPRTSLRTSVSLRSAVRRASTRSFDSKKRRSSVFVGPLSPGRNVFDSYDRLNDVKGFCMLTGKATVVKLALRDQMKAIAFSPDGSKLSCACLNATSQVCSVEPISLGKTTAEVMVNTTTGTNEELVTSGDPDQLWSVTKGSFVSSRNLCLQPQEDDDFAADASAPPIPDTMAQKNFTAPQGFAFRVLGLTVNKSTKLAVSFLTAAAKGKKKKEKANAGELDRPVLEPSDPLLPNCIAFIGVEAWQPNDQLHDSDIIQCDKLGQPAVGEFSPCGHWFVCGFKDNKLSLINVLEREHKYVFHRQMDDKLTNVQPYASESVHDHARILFLRTFPKEVALAEEFAVKVRLAQRTHEYNTTAIGRRTCITPKCSKT